MMSKHREDTQCMVEYSDWLQLAGIDRVNATESTDAARHPKSSNKEDRK